MNAFTSSWQESLHREGLPHGHGATPRLGEGQESPHREELPRREPVRDPGDVERRAVTGVAHPIGFHGGILGGAGNRVRNANGMRAGEAWRDGDDWLAEMESSIKDNDHPGRGVDLCKGVVTLPEPLNGILRFVDNPPQTEQELLEEMEAKMRVYPTLEEGWDGYDAEPLNPESLGDARKFLAHRPKGAKVPTVALSPTGEVGLYWEEKRVFAHIVFEGNGKFYYYAVGRTLSGKDISHDAEDCDADSCWPAGLLEAVRVIDETAPERDR